MSSPSEILGDVNAEELEAVDPLHWSPVDGDGGVHTGPPPQREVVVVAPVSQGAGYSRTGAIG